MRPYHDQAQSASTEDATYLYVYIYIYTYVVSIYIYIYIFIYPNAVALIRAHVSMYILQHFIHVGDIYICLYTFLRIPMPHTSTSFRPPSLWYCMWELRLVMDIL